jgi:hypothetical protein
MKGSMNHSIKTRVRDRLVRRVVAGVELQDFLNGLTPEEYRELTFFNGDPIKFWQEHHREDRAMEGFIDLKDLKKGTVYRITSRNLIVGVFDGSTDFIGIRVKFGNKYLDAECEYTTSENYGTARAKRELGVIPESIALTTQSGTECGACKRDVDFDMKRPENARWQHTADGTPLCDGPKGHPYGRGNPELYAELEKFEQQVETEEKCPQS